MRLRHKKNAEEDVLKSPVCLNLKVSIDVKQNRNFINPISLFDIFGNDHPTHLELGMGKGRFITEMSIKNNDINFIGIEKSATIVAKAIDNLKNANIQDVNLDNIDEENSISDNSLSYDLISQFPNLRFLCADIKYLDAIFMPNSIDKIYLNFSDPWPKKRHERRRLTHNTFLSIYEKLLKENSLIEFKTDNVDLFNFSLDEIKNSNFELLEFTYDLHNDKKLNEGNIMTEYEMKFSEKGNKICKLIAKSNHRSI